MHVYRWDLDKTYLETDFDTIRSLVRTATEPAHRKRAVPGAPALMRALGRRPGARISIVSGSPTQMRGVLEEKLRLDGVRFDDLVLKDNLENLKRGRIRAIRGQIGYKLPTLLEARVGMGRAVQETLFGDDAEADALVYSLYADAVAGRLSAAELSRIMEAAGAYADRIDAALAALAQISTAAAVDRIFIRLDRGTPPARFAPLGARLVPVFGWWQAALVLAARGQLQAEDAAEVLEDTLARQPVAPWVVGGWAQDLVRRGHVTTGNIRALLEASPAWEAISVALDRLSAAAGPALPAPLTGADYLSLVRGWEGA